MTSAARQPAAVPEPVADRTFGMVATDLDGTIVRSDHAISDRTVAALRAVEDSGRDVVFVTGRPPRMMAPIADRVGLHGFAVCGNGAMVYDLAAERVVKRFEVVPQVGRRLTAALRELLPRAAFAVEAADGFSREDGYPLRDDRAITRVATLEELVERPFLKLLARQDDTDIDQVARVVTDALGTDVTITHSMPTAHRDGTALLEIAAAGVSKASTLAKLCAERGVDAADVIAFGDMPNDLPTFAWSGGSYAVANAHPDVLAQADHVTASNDADGVAIVLERLLAGR